ncbi:MAG: hypothetical protein E6Q24_20075, partial [Chitinophagaceae bacterium]
MRIVVVCKSVLHFDLVAWNLREICERDSLQFFSSYADAEEFIRNYICVEQISLDLIIIQNNVDGKKGNDFLSIIRKDQERTYSNRDFNFYSVPVILLVDENENRSAFLNEGYSAVLTNIGLDKLHLFKTEIFGEIKRWRKSVLDELDNLGISFNSGVIDFSHYLKAKKTNRHCKIISDNFKRFPRRLRYDWLLINQKQIEKGIDHFVKVYKKILRLGLRNEDMIHKILRDYPFLIKRDTYSQFWHEPNLDLTPKKYYEPDFALMPNFNQRTDLSILEIKLPTEGFIRKTNFHPGPYANLLKHLFQISDYKEYLESDEYQARIKKTFGFVPDRVEYNLLIGMSDDKIENLSLLDKRMRQTGCLSPLEDWTKIV